MKHNAYKAEDFGATKVTLIIFKKPQKCIWILEGNVTSDTLIEFKKVLNEWTKTRNKEDFIVATPEFEKIVI